MAIVEKVGVILVGIADRMTRNVTPKNNYDSLRADGMRDTCGISRMWKVKGPEAARLPMIYAAAWGVTGKPPHRTLWRKYVAEAVSQSFDVEDWQPTYAFLQMQISLELLAEMEPEPKLKRQMQEVLSEIVVRCAKRAAGADKRAATLDLTEVCTDWNTGEGISSEIGYRKTWYCIRESGKAALGQLFTDDAFPLEQKRMLSRSINRLDFDQVSSNGIFFLQTACWKLRANRSATGG